MAGGTDLSSRSSATPAASASSPPPRPRRGAVARPQSRAHRTQWASAGTQIVAGKHTGHFGRGRRYHFHRANNAHLTQPHVGDMCYRAFHFNPSILTQSYPRPITRVVWAHASSQCEVSSHAGCGHTGGTHAMPRAHVDIPADRLCRVRAEAGEAPRRPPRPRRQPLTRTCSTRISRSTRARSRLKAQSACSQRPTSCEPLPRDPSASRHVYLFPSQDLPRM